MIHFNWYDFAQLTVEQLYAVLTLRSNVFVVEQNCAYLDPDGKDPVALHLLGMDNGSLVAYLRLFPPTPAENYVVFGRVVTEKSARTKGYGKKLMEELLVYCDANYPSVNIKCSAQNYLTKFYGQFGFKIYGKVYEEDGIPHIEMRRNSL
ncbi:GNAT family N-acetyltransferase [Legionella maioricensis]|uniref:GNAT family N-acetyltransferase n=1 Tax=Legionella maioricensis TaxID=2896528 RepID=A0A9X2D0T4_9GAMM|nr:GNAT family N-acetyltransferase [Legionella maioricensis]MCL9684399.1 GNAT family N-acetyltransferase [Legionella maioricensis]MCL9687580.1 GNAT family N-acetyltransferase [Legionella maioricensis]